MTPPNDDNPEHAHSESIHDESAEATTKSKSQYKREATALQVIGEDLVKLNKDQLARIGLPDNLRNAVAEAKKINQRGALKRQLQYIGKIMRNIDVELILHAMEELKQRNVQANAHFHQLELWRDRLITEDKQVLTEIFEAFPNVDHQHLRQLVRKAIREHKEEKSPTSARALFKYLRDVQDG